ncbi:NitT/TauT family transport system substrate-binding protein [Anaerobranca californiensis DSM 14826]|jgi:NitT/TauT family transport system substrate-binding protein|uniref:NitT/TauT family transport system substrate-binding protein n=1 Tax=Anaerobranca californiensis DSM 14826 TaxID=1120989 RepID=A0A1M6NNS6_9FIRM|nr:ABC transporter substrate-binding protein [Anaerobranca californiensis]SHJ97345.1 NitT/TauT family transport system substrate-binding protein [Anaerobranca californiensis DSM 14826]
MKKLIISILIIIVISSLLFVGCKPKEETLPKVRVSEVIHSIFYAPQYVALHLGFFKEEGLDVELAVAWGADRGAAALLSNSADIALFGPEAALYIAREQSDTKLIAFAQLTKRDGSFFIAREPMPNFKWEDVKGKVIIGGRPGGVPQMVQEYVLYHNGVIPHIDVEIIQNIDLAATAVAFSNGIGDFIQVFEPGASMLEKQGVGYVVASFGEAGGEIPYTVYHATEKYIKENPEIIQKFTNAIYRAQIWVDNHSAREIAEAIRPSFQETDFELLVSAVERYKNGDTWSKDPLLRPEALDRLQEIAIFNGQLTEKIPYEKVVRTDFANKAIKNIR